MQIVTGREQERKDYETKNNDGYGSAVVRYENRWADLMEAEMAAGKKLEDVAESASHTADSEGITGFMYGCAVQGLARFWAHGDALRKWHNAQHGVTEEKAQGGTVNPAILTIG
jgi:hypothetical protein